jgi:hypothetical protein
LTQNNHKFLKVFEEEEEEEEEEHSYSGDMVNEIE